MEGVCSAQVQAQNKHSRGLKTGSALALQAAFADINIHKSCSVYYWLSPSGPLTAFTMLQGSMRKFWPCLAIIMVVAAAVYQLHRQGRMWLCSCGRFALWIGDIWSPENSQQFLDPYSFTHVLHGFIFYGLLAWLIPRVSSLWRLWLAVSFEALWEVVENTDRIIERYRGVTAAIGYHGDTIVNSLGDILSFGVGFMLARHLGFRRSVTVFVVTEVVLLGWIRDSLTLNVIMLIYPIEAIRAWQMGH
jgi:hypothetical protein